MANEQQPTSSELQRRVQNLARPVQPVPDEVQREIQGRRSQRLLPTRSLSGLLDDLAYFELDEFDEEKEIHYLSLIHQTLEAGSIDESTIDYIFSTTLPIFNALYRTHATKGFMGRTQIFIENLVRKHTEDALTFVQSETKAEVEFAEKREAYKLQIVEVCRSALDAESSSPIKAIGIMGSWPRGDAHSHSDVDMVFFTPETQLDPKEAYNVSGEFAQELTKRIKELIPTSEGVSPIGNIFPLHLQPGDETIAGFLHAQADQAYHHNTFSVIVLGVTDEVTQAAAKAFLPFQ